MQSDSTTQPELTCQWCGGRIPVDSSACSRCGAARPREDLLAPGFQHPQEPVTIVQTPEAAPESSMDDEVRARQILKDLDAYIPEERPKPTVTPRDASDDAIIVVGVLAASAVVGGLTGWFLAPPLIYEVFTEVAGVDAEGPEAFRRLGGFIGALVAMLFGSLLTTMMRR